MISPLGVTASLSETEKKKTRSSRKTAPASRAAKSDRPSDPLGLGVGQASASRRERKKKKEEDLLGQQSGYQGAEPLIYSYMTRF